jgi:hypothetical protein
MDAAKQKRVLTFLTIGLVGACCGFVGGANAALIDSHMFGSGDALLGYTDMVWTVSNAGIGCPLPLAAGGEQITGAYSDNYVSTGGTYEALTVLNNTEIVSQQTARKFSMKDGLYSEQSLYQGTGQSANPQLTCGNYIDGGSSNFTATAYCEVVQSRNMFTGTLNYQSGTSIYAVDIIPDQFGIQATADGNGYGSMQVQAISMAGLTNTTSMGYKNQFSQQVSGRGNYQIGEQFTWSSFRDTFDFPETTG